jgi:hypothetical protein
LFSLYADMTGLRLTVIVLTVLLTLAAVLTACRLGKALGGIPGQVLAGLLAASLPIFVEMSTETRPYASAWAFALLALAAAGTGKPGTRTLGAGIFLGLAIGSHIDMIRIVPLVLLLQWRRAETRSLPWAEFGRTTGIALIAFLVVAPWYLLHFLDVIRQIVSVRVLGATVGEHASLIRQWFEAGIAIPLIVTVAGLLSAGLRRNWPAFACGLWLALNTVLALRPSQHGLQHDGALLVMIVALLPLAVSILTEFTPALRKPVVSAVLVAAIAGPTLWRGVAVAFADGRSLEPDRAVAWIETNVPAGTPVYVDFGRFRTLLPTPQAADRLWADVAAPEAWLGKYRHDTARLGLGDTPPLRAMSTDRLDSDRGNRRRFYMLGDTGQRNRPRYDMWLVSYGSFFDLTPATAIERLCRDGGIYLHAGTALAGLPPPAMSWIRGDDNSTYIYQVAAGSCGG